MDSLPTLSHKTKYSEQWQHTSDHLRSQGCYDWMAQQLDELNPQKVLDIGCGSGNGLLALMARFEPPNLISLEENKSCIDATVQALIESGLHPLAHPRLSYNLDAAKKTYSLNCSGAPVEMRPGISIVQTDIGCEDPFLSEALVRESPFDAITVWLVGTDGHYLHNIGSNPTDYRWNLHKRICWLADRLLRPGGWLHFVDRSIFPLNDVQMRDLIQDYEKLFESTRLEFMKLSNRPYEEAGEDGIPMARASGTLGAEFGRGLNSIISWLPDDLPQQAAGEATLIPPSSLDRQ